MSTTFNDPNLAKLRKIASETEIPDFVKDAPAITKEAFETLPFDAFGDTAKRRYPLNTKSNTWLSRQYFANDRHEYQEKVATVIDDKIQKAASFWGLDAPMKNINHDPYGVNYNIVVKDDNEKTVFDINMENPKQYKQAAEQLYANRSKYTYGMRKQIAKGLLDAPADLHAPLGGDTQSYILKAANMGSCNKDMLTQAIYKRMCLTRRDEPALFETLVKTAHDYKDIDGFIHADQLDTIAGMLDVVDRAVGLHRKYATEDQNTPEEDLFQFTTKMASDIECDAITSANGDIMSKTELTGSKKQIDEFFENHIGEVPYEDDEEMLEVIATLPADDLAALKTFIEE